MEKINQLIRDHETTVKNWEFQKKAKELYVWHARFNKKFFEGTLDVPVLSFDKTQKRRPGHYVVGRNGIGTENNINLNRTHLDDPKWQVLKTLLHEICHQWQRVYGKPGRNNYHNKEYRDKLVFLGIPCGKWGRDENGTRDPFVSFLREHGVNIKERKCSHVKPEEETRGCKLKKWLCRCGFAVRVAVPRFNATCLDCGKKFRRKKN